MKRYNSTTDLRFFAAASVLLLVFMIVAHAQSGSNVRGTVKDPAGNVVAGANVTLANEAKNFTRTQTTNQDGVYVFTAVPPETYKLSVEATGFKTSSVSGVVALVDTPTVRDVQLEIGAVSENSRCHVGV
jgi:hypothetical protein